MGGTQQSKLMNSESVANLSFLEDGQFAKLYKGHLVGSREPVTIKVPRVPEHIRKDRKQVKIHIEEVKKLMPNIKRARNEFIVKNFGVAYDDFRKEVWVIREFIDGSDLETIMKNPSLCPQMRIPEERMGVARGIAKGIAYLHNLRTPIVHGDLKPSDILIGAHSRTPKITNFGLWDFKKFFVENTLPEHVVFLNPCQAPEVLIDGERPTLFSDVWSLGATLLQWILEYPPWDLQELCMHYRYRNDKQVTALKVAMQNEEDPTILQYLDDESIEFLRECFNYQATARPKARVIEEKLSMASRTPTWTNIAYHKYYGGNSL